MDEIVAAIYEVRGQAVDANCKAQRFLISRDILLELVALRHINPASGQLTLTGLPVVATYRGEWGEHPCLTLEAVSRETGRIKYFDTKYTDEAWKA
ncbi:hypothetical protein [Fodinicurvata sediminis]|uniref:hypothetical protein n=1 Tax=Fodinicurvata sediminis TaxID=1121832 RepID=UPI0003B3B7D8|nr:hypothetical protein [Fodinicurvata sediminis]